MVLFTVVTTRMHATRTHFTDIFSLDDGLEKISNETLDIARDEVSNAQQQRQKNA